MNKQTAVEWFMEQINEYDSSPRDNTYLIEIPFWIMQEKFTKAKAMEKEQMIKFAEFVATYPDKNKNAKGDMLHAKSKYDGAERTVDLLLTYKSEQ